MAVETAAEFRRNRNRVCVELALQDAKGEWVGGTTKDRSNRHMLRERERSFVLVGRHGEDVLDHRVGRGRDKEEDRVATECGKAVARDG